MIITTNRIMHILAVARQMEIIAARHPDKYDPKEAFLLGFLHDIGYEFCEAGQDHAHVGGEMLRNAGYKHWKEVYYHGTPQPEYSSDYLWLLDYADMISGPEGELLTMEQRIDDIAKRYGKGSKQETDALTLAKQLTEIIRNK